MAAFALMYVFEDCHVSGIYPAVRPSRKYDPTGLGGLLETQLTLGDSLATRPDQTVDKATCLNIMTHW